MPIEIDCPKCDNGKIYEETGVCHPVTGFAEVLTHQCPNCKAGKIKVYTEADMKAEKERFIKLFNLYMDKDTLTAKDLIQAIQIETGG